MRKAEKCKIKPQISYFSNHQLHTDLGFWGAQYTSAFLMLVLDHKVLLKDKHH